MRTSLLLLLLAVGVAQAQVADAPSERDQQAIRALDEEIDEIEDVIALTEVRLENYLETVPVDETARSDVEQAMPRRLEARLDLMQSRHEGLRRRRQELVEGASVASAFARAANYIFFEFFDQDPVSERFSDDELRILGEHRDALNSMIRAALGWQDSVGGAMLMAHFGLTENFDFLRDHMLEPGRTYGWEGLYTSDEERYYADAQYVYHSQYLVAIEELMGAPLHEVIELTEREKRRIQDLVADPGHESHHWAIWMSVKLQL